MNKSVISVAAARKLFTECEIVFTGARTLLVRPVHRAESGLTFQIPVLWDVNARGETYCPLTPVKVCNGLRREFWNYGILIGRYIVDDHRWVFDVASLDELTKREIPDDLDVYVREAWCKRDYTTVPETMMQAKRDGAKFCRPACNKEIVSQASWGIVHSIFPLSEIMLDREMLDEYVAARLAFKGSLDFSHRGKDCAVTPASA